MTGRRTRPVKRTFVLLRFCDPLRSINAGMATTLQNSGHLKEVEFPNSATSAHIKDILFHQFQDHITRDNFPRLKFYKTVAQSNILESVGAASLICADTLKRQYRTRARVYMKVIDDPATADPRNPAGNGANAENEEQREQDNEIVEEPEDGRGQEQDYGESEDESGESENDDIALVEVLGAGSGRRQQATGGRPLLPRSGPVGERGTGDQVASRIAATARNSLQTVNSDSDEEVVVNEIPDNTRSTPISTNRSRLPRQTTASSFNFGKKFYDSVNQVPLLAKPSCSTSNVPEVGEVVDVPDVLLASEVDPGCGPAHDVKIFMRYLALNRISNRLRILCLSWAQLQLQSHLQAVPVCIIRYRLTQRAADLLRQLMTSEDHISMLSSCNVHVSIIDSGFDREISCRQNDTTEDVVLHVMQPTVSSTRMVVGDIISGSNGLFMEEVHQAVEHAAHAAQAVRAQRELLQENRDLRRSQEEALCEAEKRDRNKTKEGLAEKEDEEEEDNDDDEEETEENIDNDEMRKRRVENLSYNTRASKVRRREDDSENGGSNSGTAS